MNQHNSQKSEAVTGPCPKGCTRCDKRWSPIAAVKSCFSRKLSTKLYCMLDQLFWTARYFKAAYSRLMKQYAKIPQWHFTLFSMVLMKQHEAADNWNNFSKVDTYMRVCSLLPQQPLVWQVPLAGWNFRDLRMSQLGSHPLPRKQLFYYRNSTTG